MRRRKVSGWNVSIGVRLLGYYVELSFYPLGTLRRLMLITAGKNSMTKGWHMMAGPFHAHGYYLGWQLIELQANISHDPFWGSAISVPPGHRLILGAAK